MVSVYHLNVNNLVYHGIRNMTVTYAEKFAMYIPEKFMNIHGDSWKVFTTFGLRLGF